MHRQIFCDGSVILPWRFPECLSIHRVCVFSWDYTFDIGTLRHQNTYFASPVNRQIYWPSWDRVISVLHRRKWLRKWAWILYLTSHIILLPKKSFSVPVPFVYYIYRDYTCHDDDAAGDKVDKRAFIMANWQCIEWNVYIYWPIFRRSTWLIKILAWYYRPTICYVTLLLFHSVL